MASSKLPERASLAYLKKRAKQRLEQLRQQDASVKLAAAQLDVAREYGFSSWRALKAEIDQRRAPALAAFFAACDAGDLDALRSLLELEPGLSRERDGDGSTGLHRAIRHVEAARLLLAHGADPNARDAGDNASPLHFAAQRGNVESVRALLDAGADVHGLGDVHQSGVLGWATCDQPEIPREVVALLLERGARHHVFTAIAMRDRDLVQRLVEEDPDCLTRRRSRFEHGQTPLHFAIAAPDGLRGPAAGPDHELVDLLIELGADPEAEDCKGRTALELAMLRGDQEAVRRLHAAGARPPRQLEQTGFAAGMAALRASIDSMNPMFSVPDMAEAVRWYTAIGFELTSSHENDGQLDFAQLSFGKARFSITPGPAGERALSLWLSTSNVRDLYELLKRRQLELARTALADGDAPEPQLKFAEDLYEPFYGGMQFSIQDPSGVKLVFVQWQK